MAIFYIELMISAAEILGGSGACFLRKFLKRLMQSCAFPCIILIRFSLKKVPIFIIKKY